MIEPRNTDHIMPGATHVGAVPSSPPVLPKPPAWMDDAACVGADPELFFGTNSPERDAKAREICATCPVRQQCLEYALSFDRGIEGIFGGTTQFERADLGNQRSRICPKCGGFKSRGAVKTCRNCRTDTVQTRSKVQEIADMVDADPDLTGIEVAERVGYIRATNMYAMLRRHDRADLADQLRRNSYLVTNARKRVVA